MFPSFSIFGREIQSYAAAAILGALLAGGYSCRAARKRNTDSNEIIALLLWSALGALIGGHLLYGIVNYRLILQFIKNISAFDSLRGMIHALTAIFGGMVFYGGLAGGIAAGSIYLRKKKLSAAAYTDIAAPAIPLFHFFGRIGCFLGGCCYGIECSRGIVYTIAPFPEANGVPRLPVPLLEACFNLILFLILALLYSKNKLRGKLFCLYLTVYSAARFFLEFLRGDRARGVLFGLSTSQFISAAFLVPAGIYWLLAMTNRWKKIPEKS